MADINLVMNVRVDFTVNIKIVVADEVIAILPDIAQDDVDGIRDQINAAILGYDT